MKKPTSLGRKLAGALSAAAAIIGLTGAKEEPDNIAIDQAGGTNLAFWHEVTTDASPDKVWKLWTDVSTWKKWDKGLKDAKLEGAMRVGSKGKIIPQSGPSASFEVTEFNPRTSYTFVTNLPMAKLTLRRTITGTSPTRFRHDVSFSGKLAGLLAQRLGPGFRTALPPTMREIAALAESGSPSAQ